MKLKKLTKSMVAEWCKNEAEKIRFDWYYKDGWADYMIDWDESQMYEETEFNSGDPYYEGEIVVTWTWGNDQNYAENHTYHDCIQPMEIYNDIYNKERSTRCDDARFSNATT